MPEQQRTESFNVNAERRVGEYGNMDRRTANSMYKVYVEWFKKDGKQKRMLSFKEWVNWAKHKGYMHSADARPTTTTPAPTPTTNTSTRTPIAPTTPRIVVSTTPSSSGQSQTTQTPTEQKSTSTSSGGGGGGGGSSSPKPSDPTKDLTTVSKTGRYIAWGLLIATAIGLGYAFLGDKKTG